MNKLFYLDSLNQKQKEAVETLEGPVLVLAGAGTGKTRVLTTRLTHILNKKLAKPWEILAVTFTNKAANEMKKRVQELLKIDIERLWIGTFHSSGLKILRKYSELCNLKSSFTVIDTDDQLRVIKQILEAENIDLNLFKEKENDKRKEVLMNAFDFINQKYGKNSLRIASEGVEKKWLMKKSRCSSSFTTNLKDLLIVRC